MKCDRQLLPAPNVCCNDKETAKAVNKEMRLILKDYQKLYSLSPAQGSKQEREHSYYVILGGIKNRLADAYRDSIEFKHMNHRSVLLFIQLNNTLRAVPFHRVFVNKELL